MVGICNDCHDELKTLCHELGVNFDELPEGGIIGQARETIQLLQRHKRLADLLRRGQRVRPQVDWPSPADLAAGNGATTRGRLDGTAL